MTLIRKKGLYFVLVADALFLCVILLFDQIVGLIPESMSGCAFYKHGVLCPSCGGTRCIGALVSGNFGAAFMYNPFIFFLAIYIAAVVVLFNLEYIFNAGFAERIRRACTDYRLIIGVAVCYAVFGVARNFV